MQKIKNHTTFITMLSMLYIAQSNSFYTYDWMNPPYKTLSNFISTKETDKEIIIQIANTNTSQKEQEELTAYSSEDHRTLYIKGLGTHLALHKDPQPYSTYYLTIEYKEQRSHTDSFSEETKNQWSSQSVHMQRQSQLLHSDIFLEKATSRYNKTNKILTIIIPKAERSEKKMTQIPISIEE